MVLSTGYATKFNYSVTSLPVYLSSEIWVQQVH